MKNFTFSFFMKCGWGGREGERGGGGMERKGREGERKRDGGRERTYEQVCEYGQAQHICRGQRTTSGSQCFSSNMNSDDQTWA